MADDGPNARGGLNPADGAVQPVDGGPRSADASARSAGGLGRELGRVLLVAAIVVIAVLVVVVLTNGVSRDIRTPVTIAVLVGGTAWVLWEITRRPGSAP